ncbi:MAG: single-stranded DNA-binding protein [Chitinophagaceae bacterium]
MIRLQVIGNLGKDCITNTVNGKTVMNFSVAHTEKFKDAQGVQKDKTTWVECAYWSDRTAIAPYLKKGTQVYAEGIPELKTYPKNDGTTGASLILRVMNIQLLGGANRNEGQVGGDNAAVGSYSQNRPVTLPGEINESTDDLPF